MTVVIIKEHTSPVIAFAWLNSNIVVAGSKSTSGQSFAHEIGHARFGFKHPDNDKTHLHEGIYNVDNKYIFNDKNNLMYSYVYKTTNKLRHFQWKKIHLGKYQ